MFERMQRLMIGEAASPEARMHVAMLSGAIAAGTGHSLVADLDDDTVRSELLALARHILRSLERESGSRARRRRPGISR